MKSTPDGKDTNVPSKTPEEIKKANIICADPGGTCEECPYSEAGKNLCTIRKSRDTIAYIEQLETDNERLMGIVKDHSKFSKWYEEWANEQIARAESKIPKWTHVAEHLPQKPGKYLVYSKVGTMYTSIFDPDIHKRWPHFGKVGVTHWMPRPEEPKEE